MTTRPYRYSFHFQIMAAFLLFAIFTINLVGWTIYRQVSQDFDRDLGNTLVGIAKSCSSLLEPDLLAYLKPGSEDGLFYRSNQQFLETLRADFEIARVYIVNPSLQILIDTDTTSFVGTDVPYLQTHQAELNKTLQGESTYTTLYRGFDGVLYKSAFAPIRDDVSNIVAIACVDASPGFLQTMDSVRNSILMINLVSLVLALAIGFLMARSVVKPLRVLVDAARRISSGDYSEAVSIESNNEVGFLAQTFNTMQENIKSTQESLRDLKQRAESRAVELQIYNEYILQSIDNGIISLDYDGNFTVVNAKARHLLQLKNLNPVNVHYSQLLSPSHPMYPVIADAVSNTPHGRLLEHHVDYESEPFSLAIQISPLRDSAADIIGTSLVLTDVSELRALQDEIKEKERMAYLGMLSAAVAHEIRNPLNSIELFIGLLKRDLEATAKTNKSIEKIQQEIRTLNAIVGDILVFAKPVHPETSSFLISRLFEDTIFLAREALLKKQIETDFTITQKDIKLEGDFNQLKQALLNLSLNAIQSMPEKGELMFSASPKDDSHQTCCIEVTDTGGGILDENLSRVFEPFYSTRSQGTGLGLSIVKNIILAHQGSISIKQSGPGGTTILIELPYERNLANGQNTHS